MAFLVFSAKKKIRCWLKDSQWLTHTGTHNIRTHKSFQQLSSTVNTPQTKMSLSSEKIYKRKPSMIVRQHLLNILLRKYIKKVYGGVVAADRAKQIDRQLLRQEYYSDINECLLNFCQLKKQTKLLKTVNQFTLTNQREFIEAIKTSGSRKQSTVASLKVVGENSRWVFSPSPLLCDKQADKRFCSIYLYIYNNSIT